MAPALVVNLAVMLVAVVVEDKAEVEVGVAVEAAWVRVIACANVWSVCGCERV